MEKENQDHQSDGDTFFDQFVLQVLNRAFDEWRAIVNGYNLNSIRKPALQLCKFGFYAINDLKRVLPIAHNYNTRDGLAFTI